MTKLSDILYESGNRWVKKGDKGGYEVYESGITHSTRIAIVHFSDDEKAFNRAKLIADSHHE